MRTPDHHSTPTRHVYEYETSARYNRRVRLTSWLVTLAGLVLAGAVLYILLH
ncbi:MAG TPA: hypothetical protein VIY48_01925 [Candidatus Paceibacterota bacterium]